MRECFCPQMSEDDFLSWDMQEHDWTNKTFYRVKVPMISHFPVAPELKIPKVLEDLKAEGFLPVPSGLIVYNDGVLLGSLMIEVENSSNRNTRIHTIKQGKMISKAYKGPRHLVPKAMKQFDKELLNRGLITNDYYFWFLTCKICNKMDSENRTIIFAKV